MYVRESNYCVYGRITLESFWSRRQNKEYARHEKPPLYAIAIATTAERILVNSHVGRTQRQRVIFF